MKNCRKFQKMFFLSLLSILFFDVVFMEQHEKVRLVKGSSGFIPFRVKNFTFNKVHIQHPRSKTIIYCNTIETMLCMQNFRGQYLDSSSWNDSYVEVGIMNVSDSESGQWVLEDGVGTYYVTVDVVQEDKCTSCGRSKSSILWIIVPLLLCTSFRGDI